MGNEEAHFTGNKIPIGEGAEEDNDAIVGELIWRYNWFVLHDDGSNTVSFVITQPLKYHKGIMPFDPLYWQGDICAIQIWALKNEQSCAGC